MYISPLAVACLELNAWKQVERISKTGRNRRIHAYAMKKIDGFSDIIASIAEEEVSDYELRELERAKEAEKKVKESQKNDDGDKDDEEVTPMMKAIIEEKQEESAENNFSFF